MPLTILPEDFLKTGDPLRTWQNGHAPTWLNRHRRPAPQGPTEASLLDHEARREWLAYVEAGRFAKVWP